MEEKEIKFTLRSYQNLTELAPADKQLLEQAGSVLSNSYSPYSNYKVAAAILLGNGKTLTGTNQENASFPAGICAEGTALSAASSLYPDVAIKKIAITVKSGKHVVEHPVAPCGICRQRILEYESRFKTNIEILMMGETGKVFVVKSIKDLLPLAFSSTDL